MKLLLVEDNPADVRLFREVLKHSPAGTFQLEQAGRLDTALERLRQESFDVVLLDLGLPDAQGIQTVTLAKKITDGVPIVVLTGLDDERLALETVRAGAQDYLVKGRFDNELLVRTIHYAIERKLAEKEIRQLNAELEQRVAERTARLQAANLGLQKEIAERERVEQALRDSKQWLRVTLTSIGDAVVTCDADGRVTFLNPVAEVLTGWETAEAVSQPIQRVFRIINEETGEPAKDIVMQVLRDGRTAALANHTSLVNKVGHEIPIEDSAAPIRDPNGNVAGVVLVFHDVTERRRAEETLRQSERRVRNKLDSILSPEGDIGALELADIIDAPALQALMEEFYTLAHIPVGILDLKGNVLVGVGWQDICTKFHRVNAESCRHCLESDLELSAGVGPGEFKLYKCKNNMWDVVTPLTVGGKHIGNIFSGQFFFEGEAPDVEVFRLQARQFAFPEGEYLAALDRAPRISRDTLTAGMTYFMRLADMISRLSYSNIKLARSLAERDMLTESLRKSEERLRIATMAAEIGVWYWTPGTNYVEVSANWRRLFGVAPEVQVTFATWRNALHPEDRERATRELKAASDEHREFNIEYRALHPDGTVRWIVDRGQASYEENGRPVAMAGVNVDITDRKLAEEALRHSEQRFRTMADAMPQLAWVAKPDGWIHWYNRRWYEYTGTTTEQMQGWGWQTVHDPQTLPAVMERWKASIATGEPFDMVFPLRGIDGVFRPFLTRVLPLKDEQGQVLQWFGTNTDVSEQKAVEEALRAERDFSTAILHTASALIVVIDGHGRISRINRACETITGYTADELCGRPFWGLLPPEDTPGVAQVWNALCAGDFPNQHENHWVAKDGSRRLISWSNTALVGPDGKIQYIIATGVDVTDRKRAEDALIRSEKLASMGRMAATVAHEINNPLAAVMNSLYIARTNATLPHAVRSHLDVADEELRRVAHITRQALGFYRESTAPSPVLLNELIDSTVDLLKSKIKAKHANVETQYDGQQHVVGVAGELRQVLSNLLANSLDAILDQGTIKLRVSTSSTTNGDCRVRVTVADNGVGIDPAVRLCIFEPLVTTKESVGTGLGLWVSKQIIHKHGGSIRMHSRTEGRRRGTTFSIVLPTKAAACA